jgi:hypothetical protein
MAVVLKPDILPSVIWERTSLHPRLSRARTELSSQAITTMDPPTTIPILKLRLHRHHRETTELDLHRAVRSGVNSCYRCIRSDVPICIQVVSFTSCTIYSTSTRRLASVTASTWKISLMTGRVAGTGSQHCQMNDFSASGRLAKTLRSWHGRFSSAMNAGRSAGTIPGRVK